jgi:hypothetical protein
MKRKKSLMSILLLVVFIAVFTISPVRSFADDDSSMILDANEKITVKVLLDNDKVRTVQSTDANNNIIVATFDKKTEQLTITENGKTVYEMNTDKVDEKHKTAAVNIEKIRENNLNKELLSPEKPSSSRNETNQTLATDTTSTSGGWECVESNIDLVWGFYYAQWHNDGVYSWDAINGNGDLKMVDPEYEDNSSNIYSFKDQVDSMLNNEYTYIFTLAGVCSAGALAFIYSGGSLSSALYSAGGIAVGIIAANIPAARNISLNVNSANRYWGYLEQ